MVDLQILGAPYPPDNLVFKRADRLAARSANAQCAGTVVDDMRALFHWSEDKIMCFMEG